ncbi:MAG: peptide chain release factor N(5)-glutamine methyltransferase [Actinobacteria bacterium]|nr:peptide chain release factor N(5)-glutamine methyltransferase [Actinomycetota bacterium]
MEISSWLVQATAQLTSAGITTARLDCLVLLEDAVEQYRSWLLAHQEHQLDELTVQKLDKQIERRAQHEPLAYIRGKSEFYGHEFNVNAHTLQPRPETETMVELLKELVDSRQLTVDSNKKPATNDNVQATTVSIMGRLHGLSAMQGVGEKRTDAYKQYAEGASEQTTQQRAKRASSVSSLADEQASSAMSIVDVGTGSGCIAITAKMLYPNTHVIATDIDKKCLETAEQNAKKHNVEVDFREGNLLEPLSNIKHQISNIILMANLPYVPDSHTINKAAMHEPKHAIFGGGDGLDYYRHLFDQISSFQDKPIAIFTESLPTQHKTLISVAEAHGYQAIQTEDFIVQFSPAEN